MTIIFEGLLWVHYGQAYILPSGSYGVDLDSAFRGQRNGLCGAATGDALFLITGLHTGVVEFRLEAHKTEPRVDDLWEEIVEASLTIGAMGAALVEWGNEHRYPVPLTPGTYRVRYCSIGMQQGADIDSTDDNVPVGKYFLSLWPSTPAPDQVVKESSDVAKYWHGYAKSII